VERKYKSVSSKVSRKECALREQESRTFYRDRRQINLFAASAISFVILSEINFEEENEYCAAYLQNQFLLRGSSNNRQRTRQG
jgi:hypothetical protein